MRTTFLGFESARKGMSAAQKAIDVTGNNITNINTPGYTRQRIDLVSMSAPTNGRYAPIGSNSAGQGVAMIGVSQIRNPYLDARFRDEYCNTGYYDKALSILDSVEGILNEVEGGIKPIFNEFIAALQEFSTKPDQITHANIVLSSAKSVAQVIKQQYQALQGLQEQYTFEFTVDVMTVNETLGKITALNQSVKDILMNQTNKSETTNINELLDQRNMLVDELAKYGNIKVGNNPDGTISIHMDNQLIVDGTFKDQLHYQINDDYSVQLTWNNSGQNVILNSGQLKASMELLNVASGEFKGIPYYSEQLNKLAGSFASVLNQAFLKNDGSYCNLIDGSTALNLTISKEWMSDAGYIMKDLQNNGAYDNTHILNVINKLEGKGNVNDFDGSISSFIDVFVTTLGQDKNYIQGRFDASYLITSDLENRRDAVSAVSLDEEGANLMMFDKTYKATSRLMTVFDEALDVLINKTGLVGR